MVWQSRAHVIAMTTQEFENGRCKCQRYIPVEIEVPEDFGGLHVSLNQQLRPSESVVHRILTVVDKASQETREIHHLQFIAWPDHGVPEDPQPFVDFQDSVLGIAHRMNKDAPVIVHCSAGIGRTGTFIAIDIARRQLAEHGRVDVYEIVKALRQQRAGMVQTPQQYLFCYEALVHLLPQPSS